MINRLLTSLGLVAAAFIASTGAASAAFLETKSDVMYAAGAAVVVLLVLASIGAGVKHAFGLDVMPPPDPNDDHGSHGAGHGDGHAEPAAHGEPAAAGAHGSH